MIYSNTIKKRKRKKFLWFIIPKIVLIILIISVGFMLKIVWFMHKKSEIAKEKEERLLNEYRTLKDKKDKLEEQVENLNTKRGREAALRKKFNLGKKGEGLIVILDKEIPKKQPIEKKSVFQSIKNFFGF